MAEPRRRKLLVISYRFPPETYPLAIRVGYMLGHLKRDWEIHAVTGAARPAAPEGVTVHSVGSGQGDRLMRTMRRMKLRKFADWFLWPDPFVSWRGAAYRKALQVIEELKPDAILVFMMPYSQGRIGLKLKQQTGLPLILNLNDSPTCADMSPHFATRLHHRLAVRMEDQFARESDAIIYVSGHNMERVRDRQPPEYRDRFHLVRRGARPIAVSPDSAARSSTTEASERDVFRVVYTGAMSGWHQLLHEFEPPRMQSKLFRAWVRFGRHYVADMDHRNHSPVYIGRAINRVVARHPEWAGRIQVDVFGNRFPTDLVSAVLRHHGVEDVVRIHGVVPHAQSQAEAARADLLFQALPERTDGEPGGRISAKTYEYLMTDRPILASLPPGENADYFRGKPGVDLVDPKDVDGMARCIERHVAKRMSGAPLSVDRTQLQLELTDVARARAFAAVLDGVVPRPA